MTAGLTTWLVAACQDPDTWGMDDDMPSLAQRVAEFMSSEDFAESVTNFIETNVRRSVAPLACSLRGAGAVGAHRATK